MQPAPLTALGSFVAVKCLQASFLSAGLEGAALTLNDSGHLVDQSVVTTGPATLTAAVRDPLTGFLADDRSQLKQLRELPGSLTTCPEVDVSRTVWETLLSLVFNTTDFDPFRKESAFLQSMYFLEAALPFIVDPPAYGAAIGILTSEVKQATTLADLMRIHANDTTIGSLTLRQTIDTFNSYLASINVFQVAPGTLETAPTDSNGKLPTFASLADYLRLLQIPGSRRGGQFFPNGLILATPSVPVSAGRRLLSV
ncbi:hypothetical protein WJX74_010535 [Apatococcus lobatus]|uniref:Uncharacterized protein n=1 Tax=Apatococcus lobatus TaxID=904363 RepID=A0AAW1R453_9CHLO